MKRTTQDVTIKFRDYGTIVVPKGTAVTSQTADGYNSAYNFVNEFGWIATNYPEIASILKHDAVYYGINIPVQFVC